MNTQQVHKAIKQAYQGLRQFMVDIFSIKKQRDELVREVLEEARQEKIKSLKSQVKNFK